jgi:hypothetical protein
MDHNGSPARHTQVRMGSPGTSSQTGPGRTTTRTYSGSERGHDGGKSQRVQVADLNRDQKSETPGPIIISHIEERMSALKVRPESFDGISMTCSVAGDRYSWYAANKAKQFQWQHPWWYPQMIEMPPNVSGQTLRETLMRRIETIMRTLPARHSIVIFDTRVSRLLRDIPAHPANDARGWPALSVHSASRQVYREALRPSKTGLVIA